MTPNQSPARVPANVSSVCGSLTTSALIRASLLCPFTLNLGGHDKHRQTGGDIAADAVAPEEGISTTKCSGSGSAMIQPDPLAMHYPRSWQKSNTQEYLPVPVREGPGYSGFSSTQPPWIPKVCQSGMSDRVGPDGLEVSSPGPNCGNHVEFVKGKLSGVW